MVDNNRAQDKSVKVNSVDAYIAQFPLDLQERLQAFRAAVRAAAPDAQETIGYQMPSYKLNGNLVHFAAFKHHIGFYPGSSGIAPFKEALSAYKVVKGTIQFRHSEPIPYELIKNITALRVVQNGTYGQ